MTTKITIEIKIFSIKVQTNIFYHTTTASRFSEAQEIESMKLAISIKTLNSEHYFGEKKLLLLFVYVDMFFLSIEK